MAVEAEAARLLVSASIRERTIVSVVTLSLIGLCGSNVATKRRECKVRLRQASDAKAASGGIASVFRHSIATGRWKAAGYGLRSN